MAVTKSFLRKKMVSIKSSETSNQDDLSLRHRNENILTYMITTRQKNLAERISADEDSDERTRYLTLQNQTKRFLSSQRSKEHHSIWQTSRNREEPIGVVIGVGG